MPGGLGIWGIGGTSAKAEKKVHPPLPLRIYQYTLSNTKIIPPLRYVPFLRSYTDCVIENDNGLFARYRYVQNIFRGLCYLMKPRGTDAKKQLLHSIGEKKE